ncbi:MAG TPA: hypothetical protein VGP07_26130 [Polyangia bacterium]|jgi:hypothetical protein
MRAPALDGRRVHGLPTKVVTVLPASVAEKRAALTGSAVLDARLSVAEVTQGVIAHAADCDCGVCVFNACAAQL